MRNYLGNENNKEIGELQIHTVEAQGASHGAATGSGAGKENDTKNPHKGWASEVKTSNLQEFRAGDEGEASLMN